MADQPTMHTAHAVSAVIHLRRQIACRYWKIRLERDSIGSPCCALRAVCWLEVPLRDDHDVARTHCDVVADVAIVDQAVEARADRLVLAVEVAHHDRAI